MKRFTTVFALAAMGAAVFWSGGVSTAAGLLRGAQTATQETAPQTTAPPGMPTQPAPAAAPKQDTPAPLSTGNLKVIVIDAGHGGIDTGASNAGVLEKDLTLALARRLRAALQSRLGASVVLTRDSDVELSNEARTETAANNQAGLFISLHVGYSPNKTDSGASIFVMKPDFSGGMPADTSGERLFLPWALAFRDSTPASQSFASMLQEGLNQALPGWKFPVRNGPIAVLASLTMPAVAVEAGNLNNEVSVQTLSEAGFQTRLTSAIAEAVAQYSRISSGSAQ